MASIRKHNESKVKLSTLIHATFSLLLTLTLFHKLDVANCEAKEFDWGDLGVSLANKLPLSGASNNLRILVSPQRRMTKNYEFDYTNYTQPNSSQSETSYVIPGSSSGSSYVPASPSQSSQSSAYSALSASLATLKNRLSARGMTLSSTLGDTSSQTSLYQSPSSAYGSSLLGDAQQSAQQGQTSAQSQPTYLSVANQQDQQTGGGYVSAQGQANDNKTIVLAIPAKINFLTDSRAQSVMKQQQQQSQQQPQHNQQLAVIQASGDQQTRPDYSGKQLGLITGQDNTANPVNHMAGREAGNSEQDNHQYVIVNTPTAGEHSQLATSGPGLTQPAYPGSIYQTSSVQSTPAAGQTYTMKYIPTYPQAAITYSEEEQFGGRGYGGCIDTCNSADVRWRKYTVSKYKFCCSRSSQYDPQFEQPSIDKLGEASKLADDAYYNYLYRRTKSRKSRRLANRYRHYKQASTPASASGDDSSVEGVGSDSGRSIGSSGRYDHPYMRYYRNRPSSYGSTDMHDSVTGGTGGKFSSKERSYRRGRSRDLDNLDPNQTYDSQDDEGSYADQSTRGGSGYGSGDESVDAAGRYASEGRANDEDDVRSSPNYGDEMEPDSGKGIGTADGSDYPEDSASERPLEESEPETTPSYKYTANRRKKQASRGRSRAGKPRRSRRNRINKLTAEYSPTNGTDNEPTTEGDQYRHDMGSSHDDEKQQHNNNNNNKDSAEGSVGDKETIKFSNKLKAMGLNDTAVVNLSKTTMHLKEILSMLEKKTHFKTNESTSNPTTPAPPTTISATGAYPITLMNPQYSNSAPIQLPTDYLSPEMSMKSPYRYESSSLSLPSYQTLGLDNFGSLPAFSTNQFGINSKHIHYPAGHHPRKRRTNKHVRYNHLLMGKPHGLASATSLLQHSPFGKNQLLSPSYYSSMQYPYSYTRANYPSTFATYPYKSLNKNTYPSSLTGGHVSSKLAGGALYSDESRIHGMSSLDPLANMASSLRPSTTMRLRSKPFVFQPHVLPIYTRHSILTQPGEKK